MSSFMTTELINGLLIIGAVTAATIIICPLLVWALTVPVPKMRTAST